MSIAHDIPFDTGLGHVPGATGAGIARLGSHTPRCIASATRGGGRAFRCGAPLDACIRRWIRCAGRKIPTCDMPLSELYRWQQALEVPVSELLVDSDSPLSEPVLTRARLLRVMKTVRAIKESASAAPIQRFATMLEAAA